MRVLPSLLAFSLAGMLLLPNVGCRNSGTDPDLKTPRSTKEAAAQLEAAFANEDADTKARVREAAAALREGKYEKAIVTLQTLRALEPGTMKQGLAVHNSLVTLEMALVEAMDGGNQDAKRAFELLKQWKRR